MESKTDYGNVVDGRVVPIYYGEYYLIGDTILRNQYESDKCEKSEENTRPPSCNEQCSFWTHKREDSTVDVRETTETANEASVVNALLDGNARPFIKDLN